MNIVYVSPYSHNGFACVKREDDLWNYIDKKGNLLSPNQWFKWIGIFYNGFARVQREDRKWNYIN